MTLQGTPELEDLTDKVLERCRARRESAASGPDRFSGLETFAALLIGRMDPADLPQMTADDVYGAVLSLWRLASQRTPGRHMIRTYNPRLDEDGWTTRHTVIEIVNDDMPFLVDSVVSALNQAGEQIHRVLHPVVRLDRSDDGIITAVAAVDDATGDLPKESIIQIEIGAHSDPADQAAITRRLETVLTDVRQAVEDWPTMMDHARQMVADLAETPPPGLPEHEIAEARALLEWMVDNHFTFLGYREYDYLASRESERLEIVPDTGLGLLRDPERRVMDRPSGAPTLSPEVREFLSRPELVIITKTNRRSTVHRPVYLDYIGIKRFNAAGEVIGERRFVGLLTSAAYNRTPREIPYLRLKAARVMERSGFDPRGHAGKALMHVIDTYPRDELFQVSEDDLLQTAMAITGLYERPRIRLFIRRDRFERFFSCLVFVPRDRYDSELRRRFEAILADGLGGHVSAFFTQIGDTPLARLHVIVSSGGGTDTAETAVLEQRLIEAARSWDDKLAEILTEAHGEERAANLLRRYAQAFGAAYREQFSPGLARIDIERIESVPNPSATGRPALGLNLFRLVEDDDSIVRLKLFRKGQALTLSDVLPMLEHMGLRVLAESTFRVGPAANPICWIHEFRTVSQTGKTIELARARRNFEDAFVQIFAGEMEDDGFNGLILGIGLSAADVRVLRAYARFLRQAGMAFSQDYVERTLAANPDITALLSELFQTRFDPAVESGRDDTAGTIVESIEVLLNAVESLDEDRILRRFLNAISATLRTNHYQTDADGRRKTYLSLKFNSQALDDLPLPRPLREIFVYSPRFEGVHLRGGLVARGGLRWSDRREDFRTEVLGLVKAQMVKNAVIVPTGSKGGFVPKFLPVGGDREAIQAEGIACYRQFISGLLDLTDNIVDGAIVPPRDVVRHDSDDPYLVVAADKGTATFSDYANEVAVAHGFWLGDAFASGGAAGYDHKKMGITARGAWECVKRHFREMGTDIQTQPFTAVGVGDMSGDVFGNGMLLSEQTRLIAAFDHRHIFIDPDPDTARSHAERARMFALPRSSWDDYDRSVLSPGAMIIDRKSKKVPLTPEAAAAIDMAPGEYTPFQIMQAVLRAPVDLLWFGGIGTYVKSPEEGHADAGDRANDMIRINADEVRARVLGEGANLGITQRGRIAFAENGGRINTDFVDNSAGVDCSDHEVNLKILLGAVEANGDMTRKQRDRLLADMTDDVAELVLADNYVQGQAITVAEAAGRANAGPLGRLMRSFARAGLLDRKVEFLPTDEDLAERSGGLTRPEIAVLLSYAKMVLKQELLSSDLPDDPDLETELVAYFPNRLHETFADAIAGHRLRREIIATRCANFMVNRAGPAFARLAEDELGVAAADIAQVTMAVSDIFDLAPLWAGIDALDNQVPAAVQTRMLTLIQGLIARAGLWFLRYANQPVDRAALIARFRPPLSELRNGLADRLGALERAAWEQQRDQLIADSVPADLAAGIAALAPMATTLDIVEAAEKAGSDTSRTAIAYFAIGDRLGLSWLRAQAGSLTTDSSWDRQAIAMLIDESYVQQRSLAIRALTTGGDDPVATLEAADPAGFARADQALNEVRSSGAIDIARLVLANRQVGRLVN